MAGCGGTGGVESIEPFLDDTLPPGSSGALVAGRGDTVDVCRGWGEPDEGTGERAGCDTVFDIMSMTKQFTAAAVVRLGQDGLLDVGDPLAEHLPGVPADKQGVTIEHLLTHTSGLLDTLGPDDDPLTRDAFLREALGSELLSEPGTTYLYSNVGYSLLTAVVEEVSGQDYEAYLAEHLFEPAGMTSTGYVLPDWSEVHVAVEHDAAGRPQGTPLDHPWADDGPYWNLRGNGGLLSTPRDMFRWHVALRGDTVLADDARRKLFEPRVREEPDETYYAYGWVADDRDDPQILWHNGGNGRAYGEIGRDPAGDVFVFWVANRAAGDGWDLGESGTDLTSGLFERLSAG
ncbi:serine hydrolase domain-containing protein [Promicromonospora kroppenstedtii]|uniref:serine hydrolase domain-containing protein n=1 Tax=Promicromonospora kroppenstedtii TaxID=440482 RepID=UPI00055DA966|nr:serine hydrolase domain-containing protein [Promicromonospora kroppenstedtii]